MREIYEIKNPFYKHWLKRQVYKVINDFHKKFPNYTIEYNRTEENYEGRDVTNIFLVDKRLMGKLTDKDLEITEEKDLSEIEKFVDYWYMKFPDEWDILIVSELERKTFCWDKNNILWQWK